MDKMYLENLEELILDENKIITYKGLSCILQIHVNTAKQMLYSFLQNQRNEKNNSKLTCSYLLSGSQIDEAGCEKIKVKIVPEESLEDTKSSLKVIFSCHIYSIQQCKIKDANVLYQADYSLIKDNLNDTSSYGAIRYPDLKKRESQVSSAQSQEKGDGWTSIKSHNNQNSQLEVNQSKGNKISNDSSIPSVKSSPKKSSNTKSSPCKNKNDDTKKPDSKKSKGNIASMFANAPAKKNISPSAPSKTDKKNSDDESSVKEKVPTKSDNDCESNIESEFMECEDVVSNKSVSKSKRITDSDEEEDEIQTSKKRKVHESKNIKRDEGVCSKRSRMIISDSEDEDCIIPPTPPVKVKSPKKTPKKTPQKVSNVSKEIIAEEINVNKENENNVTKVTQITKKLISKTYMNDEGYMVTEKVYEKEVTEVPESQIKPIDKKLPEKNKEEKKNKSQKISNVNKGGGKQTSMMSYFKKQ